MNGIEIKNLPLLTSISGNEDLMISTQEGKARRIKTNLVAGNITTLKLNSMSEMNRVDLSDGIYNIDGAISGALIIVNSHNNNVLESVLQTYIDSTDIYTREITISANQVYPTWKVKSVTLGSVYRSDMFNIVDTNGFINGTLWTDVYKFLLIPGSYGVLFTTEPLPLLAPGKINFTLKVEYASYMNSGNNEKINYIHTLTEPDSGKSFIRKVIHTTNGFLCTQFTQISGGNITIYENGGAGQDGIGYQFIYKLANSDTPIGSPISQDSDNFVPSGWSTTLSSVSSSNRFAFMSSRTKMNGKWGLYSTPAIIATYIQGPKGDTGDKGESGTAGNSGPAGPSGQSGKDGESIEFIFNRTQNLENPAPLGPPIGVNDASPNCQPGITPKDYNKSDWFPIGWTDNMQGVDINNPYEWVSTRVKRNNVWQSFKPAKLWAKWSEDGGGQGPQGKPGSDGRDYEWIFKRSATLLDVPKRPVSTNNEDNDIPTQYYLNGVLTPIQDPQWTADAQGVTEELKYEWSSKRFKIPVTQTIDNVDVIVYRWQEWSIPILSGRYNKDGKDGIDGKDGRDGDNYELIFKRTLEPSCSDSPSSMTKSVDSPALTYQDNDWFPIGWSDDAQILDGVNYKYQWMSRRRKITVNLGSISPNDPVPTPDKSGYYTFNNSGTCAWITSGVNTVVVGDRVVVRYLNGNYEYLKVVTGVSTSVWEAFKAPTLWNMWTKNGVNGDNSVNVSLSRNVINLSCMADGVVRTGYTNQNIQLYAYEGSKLTKINSILVTANGGYDATDFVTVNIPNQTESKGVATIVINLENLPLALSEISFTFDVYMEANKSEANVTKVLDVIKVYDGYAGPAIVARGAYSNAMTYYGNSERVDAVSVTNDEGTTWYITRQIMGYSNGLEVHSITNIKPGATIGWENYWIEMPSFEMIATGMLLAENANIAEFIFNGGKLYSQWGTNPDTGAVTANEPLSERNLILDGVHGMLIANNAKIKGNITATSGKIANFDILNGNIIGKDINDAERIRLSTENIPEISDLKLDYSYIKTDIETFGNCIIEVLWDNQTNDYFTQLNEGNYITNSTTLINVSSAKNIVVENGVINYNIHGSAVTIDNVIQEITILNENNQRVTGGTTGQVFSLPSAGNYKVKIKTILFFGNNGFEQVSEINFNSKNNIRVSGDIKRTAIGLNGFYSYFSELEYVYFKTGYGFEVRIEDYGLQITKAGIKKMIAGNNQWVNL